MHILAGGDFVASWWWPIISSAFTTLIAFAIVDVLFKRFVFVPKLKPVLRGDKFGRLPTVEDISVTAELPTAGEGPPVKVNLSRNRRNVVYVRLSITNEGRETARGCRGFLVNFERILGHDKSERLFFDHVPLGWSYLPADAAQVVDIPPGGKTTLNLDVISTAEGESEYTMRLVSMPNCYKEVFRQQGEFRLTIHVTADNAATEERILYLKWHGDWQNFKVTEWLI